MGGKTTDTFRSALCCYLNILYHKGKRYAPAKIFIQPLADKVLHNSSPLGLHEAHRLLLGSGDYVKQVTRGWRMLRCYHCGYEETSTAYSYFFMHSQYRHSRRCDLLCLDCVMKVRTCQECNSLCDCCAYQRQLVATQRRQFPASFFSHCVTNGATLTRFMKVRLANRCCAKHYSEFDEMTRLYMEEHCTECKDRIECLLVRT
jgi:hypothetical protein